MKKLIIVLTILFFANNAYAGWLYTARKVSTHSVTGTNVYVDGFLRVGDGATAPYLTDRGDIWAEGTFSVHRGIFATATNYGMGVQVRSSDYVQNLPYSNADFYAEGGIVYVSGADFIDDGVVTGDIIAVSSGVYEGAVGEIISVTTNTINVSVASAGDNDLISATGLGFVVYKPPLMMVLDRGDIHFNVGVHDDASFKIASNQNRNDHIVHIDADGMVTGSTVLDIDMDSCVTGSTSAIGLNYCAKQYVEGFTGTGFDVSVDIDGSTGGDIHIIDVQKTGTGDVDLSVMATGPGVDVIHQHIGTEANLDYGETYDASTTTYTDTTTQFNTAGDDIQIFIEDDDAIYVASTEKFDQINVILDTGANFSIAPTFEYAEANAVAWHVYTPGDDTDGFQQSGTIRYDSNHLLNWGLATEAQVTGAGDAVDCYWVRITRTRNNLVVIPVESTIGVTSLKLDYEWDKVGHVTTKTVYMDKLKLNESAPGNTPPTNTAWLYVDSADGDLKVKWDDGTVETIEDHP